MGNEIVSGPNISVFYVRYFSNTFSLFQLELKSYRTKQCWPYIDYYIEFLYGNSFIYKNLHIEPFLSVNVKGRLTL